MADQVPVIVTPTLPMPAAEMGTFALRAEIVPEATRSVGAVALVVTVQFGEIETTIAASDVVGAVLGPVTFAAVPVDGS